MPASATLEHAAALAQWSSETLGVSAEGRGYRFWRRDTNDRWSPFTGDEVLGPLAKSPLDESSWVMAAGLPISGAGTWTSYTLDVKNTGGGTLSFHGKRYPSAIWYGDLPALPGLKAN